MYGIGILKGLGVTLRHFVETYLDDIKWAFAGGRYGHAGALRVRNSLQERGVFTVQYPEEKIAVPERFRFIPFLLYDDATKEDRCTSCGICPKVCPPQCIWIVRTNDPQTGRPIPAPKEFYIDVDICMNCGFCAEFCPFDAIKMDHDYELADYDRTTTHIFDKAKLSKPVSYYATIRPTDYSAEEAVRAAEEAKKAARRGGGAAPTSNVAAARERAAAQRGAAAPAAPAEPAAPSAPAAPAEPAAPKAEEPKAEAPKAEQKATPVETPPPGTAEEQQAKTADETKTTEDREVGAGEPAKQVGPEQARGEGAIAEQGGAPQAPGDNEARDEQKSEAADHVPPETPPSPYEGKE